MAYNTVNVLMMEQVQAEVCPEICRLHPQAQEVQLLYHLSLSCREYILNMHTVTTIIM